MSTDLPVCKTLAPEDLSPGMDITVLHFVREYTPLPGCFTDDDAVGKTVRWNERPRRVVPPLRVVGVCLPLVLAEDPLGVPRTLDIRAVRLARIDESFAAGALITHRARLPRAVVAYESLLSSPTASADERERYRAVLWALRRLPPPGMTNSEFAA